MLYISLPWCIENHKFNLFFRDYVNLHQDQLVEPLAIEYVHGTFPWTYWNGYMKSTSGELILAPKVEELIHSCNAPLALDCANINLTSTDYLDIYENILLQKIVYAGGVCEISDLKLLSFLLDKYPYMNFIISHLAEYNITFNEQTLTTLINQPEVKLIYLNPQSIINLKNKKKIGIIISECEKCSKEQCEICQSADCKNNYLFSKRTTRNNCGQGILIDNYYKTINKYSQQGFSHFKIVPSSMDNINQLNLQIITSFIKPDFVGECIKQYEQFR